VAEDPDRALDGSQPESDQPLPTEPDPRLIEHNESIDAADDGP